MSVRVFPNAVESAADLPRFCQGCGRALVVEERTDGFDARIGAPVLRAYAFCRGSWLERLFVGSERIAEVHGSYIVSPRPQPSDVEPWGHRVG